MYEIGDYGYWKFMVKKLIHDKYYENNIEMYGEITKADEQQIKIVDCYDIEYRIFLPRLIKFEKQDKPQ